MFVDAPHPCAQLEYDNERAGTFAPLSYLPLNKMVVLGLVTTKHGKVRVIGLSVAHLNNANVQVSSRRWRKYRS